MEGTCSGGREGPPAPEKAAPDQSQPREPQARPHRRKYFPHASCTMPRPRPGNACLARGPSTPKSHLKPEGQELPLHGLLHKG